MSTKPLYKKLGIKSGNKVFLYQSPVNYFDSLEYNSSEIQLLAEVDQEEVDFLHAFFYNKEELQQHVSHFKKLLNKSGMMWVSWPKSNSDLYQDLKRDDIRNLILDIGLVDVKVCSYDTVWSGLKFVYRTADRK